MKYIKNFEEFVNESKDIKINEGAFSGIDKEVMSEWKKSAEEFKAIAKEIKSLEPRVKVPNTSYILTLTKTLLPGYVKDEDIEMDALYELGHKMEDLQDELIDPEEEDENDEVNKEDMAQSSYYEAICDLYDDAMDGKNIKGCLQLMKKLLPLAKKVSMLKKK